LSRGGQNEISAFRGHIRGGICSDPAGVPGNLEMVEGKTMKETFFENIKTQIITSASWVNNCACDHDMNRNHVNYGCVTAYSHILSELGHSVDVAVWEDDGYLKIPKITIDAFVVEFSRGK
jgi:hypothetical protein